jgi:hypothetical protein
VTPVIKATGLPLGLLLTDNHNGTATISGTPAMTDAGPKTGKISAVSTGFPAATQAFTITVDNVPVFSSPSAYTDATGGAFSFKVKTVHGYPIPSMTASGLPSGVTLTDDGDGTALLADAGPITNGGKYTFTISANSVTQTFKLTLNQAPKITSAAVDGVLSGVAMSPFTVTTTGFPAPSFVVSGLPLGVKLVNNRNGTATLSGKPTVPGNYTVTIGAKNGAGADVQTFGLNVAGPKQGVVAMVPTPDDGGYWMASNNGSVVAFGDAHFYNSLFNLGYNVNNIVGFAATTDGGGYWLVDSGGGVYAFGDAALYGSTGGLSIPSPIVGITRSADGHGYWLVDMAGGVYAFGDAAFYGSAAGLGYNSVLSLVATNDGRGYWITDANGDVDAYGDAGFFGSLSGITLSHPIVGMTDTPDGGGYWLVASDGEVFSFGDAVFYGSTAGLGVNVGGIARYRSGVGYWHYTVSGEVYAFGDAVYYGSM